SRAGRPGHVDGLRAASLVAVAAALALGACGDQPGGTTEPSGETPAVVLVTPDAFQLAAGETRKLSAAVRDATGEPLGVAVQWSVDSPEIAEVSTAGEVRGLRAGETRVVARAGGVSGAADVTVVPGAPASIIVEPGLIEIFTPESRQLTAEVRDAGGNLLGVP